MFRQVTRQLLTGLPLLALISSEGCSSSNPSPPAAPNTPATATTTASVAPTASTAPTADQLYQLVAPIALFPDKLLAQVLAASTHPDQVTAEAAMLQQNPGLTAAALQAALTPQAWDPAVKGLASFPSVLKQMAQSPDWTRALGQAYLNDPSDLMNAVQVLRQRAMQQGHLKSTPQQTVMSRAAPVTSSVTTTVQTTTQQQVVPAPSAYVEISPAQPEVVYVPSYNPGLVYGVDYGTWPGYYAPAPAVVHSDWSAGIIGFGAGIAVGALLTHPWGWSHWGMHWGGPTPGPGWGYAGGGPAVSYDQRRYNVQNINIQNIHQDIHQNFAGHGLTHNGFGQPPSPPVPAWHAEAGPHPAMTGIGPNPRGYGPSGGHWQAPQFDQHLNANRWAAGAGAVAAMAHTPTAAGLAARPAEFAASNGLHAHAGPSNWQASTPAPHHPVSYIHNDGNNFSHPAAGWHASSQPEFNRPQTAVGSHEVTASTREYSPRFTPPAHDFPAAAHVRPPSFHPAERPAPEFHPPSVPHESHESHSHAGGHHHR